MSELIKVMVAEDHPVFRDGLKLILANAKGILLTATAEDGNELIEFVNTDPPHVILMDIHMPHMNGIEATRIIKESYPEINIIGLSMHEETKVINQLIDLQVSGYLTKNADANEIIEACHNVAEGGTYFDGLTYQKILKFYNTDAKKNNKLVRKVHVTPREKEVILQISKQKTNKEIASEMNVQEKTIEQYRKSIMEKIEARNVIGVILYAIKSGIIDLEE